MSRSRALIALLLAVTWCSAAFHVDLEGLGLLLEHCHGADGVAHHAAEPTDHGDEHVPLAVQHNVQHCHVRVIGPGAGPLVPLIGELPAPASLARRFVRERSPRLLRDHTGPPQRRIWQFIERCAPQSAAPPALA